MKIKVDKENIRIDKYLVDYIDKSRNVIIKLIEDGLILVNEKKIKPSYKVKMNDLILIKEELSIKNDFKPQNIPLDIYYEDDHIIVVNKASGLVVHPGNGHENNTLVNALMFHTDNLSDVGGKERLGIVHRLDKDTSGLMIVAKTNEAHHILVKDFKNKNIKRQYIALIDGVFKHNKAVINAPIGRDPKKRKQFIVTSKNSKKATTKLMVLKRYRDYTLVKLTLETGRTHQIRVHMKYIGFPIYNDPIYNKNIDDYGQYLHSSRLEFNHPISKEKLKFNSPLPNIIQSFIDNLEEK